MNAALVIPALDEEATIASIVTTCAEFGQPIVVDDGSTDRTAQRAANAGAIVVRHPSNLGYDAALRSGLMRALDESCNPVATLDADGQHDAAVLHSFIEPIAAGRSTMVLGIRSAVHRPSEKVFNRYTRARFGVDDILCGMKAYDADLVRSYAGSLDAPTIGTGLALAALRARVATSTVAIQVRARRGDARFGTGFGPNARIFAAMARAVAQDVRHR